MGTGASLILNALDVALVDGPSHMLKWLDGAPVVLVMLGCLPDRSMPSLM